jgi:HEAT repeat protein
MTRGSFKSDTRSKKMKTRLMISATLALLLAVWMAVPAEAASAAELEKQFLSKIDELLPGMGAQKLEDRQEPQLAFERICFDNSAPDKQAEREALCKAMMQRVGPDVAMPARVWLLRKVESIGREEVVPQLTALLADSDAQICELARRALQNNRSAQAGAALRAELDTGKTPAWRIAIINALAFRKDAEAVPQLAKLCEVKRPLVARAAILALGDIGDDRCVETLANLRKNTRPELQAPLTEASFRAAEALIARGAGEKAAAIYEELNNPSAPENVRITAVQGIAAAKGAGAIGDLLKLINGSDERMQLVAARCAQRICGENVTKQLTEALNDASPDAQAVLLEMLGQRGDASALPAVAKYIQVTNPDVRIAAVGAMRYIGNGSMVEGLAKLAAQATGPERDAARESLKWMRGQCVDDAILKQLGNTESRVSAELVRAAAVRLMKPAFGIMLKHVNDPDESVRVPVIYNVGKLANPEDLGAVLKAFSKLETGQSPDVAKDALVRICQQTADENQRTRGLIESLNSAEPSVQIIIVQALTNLKGQPALDAIRGCVRSSSPQVKKAAQKALADWGPAYCTQWVFAGPYQKDGAGHTDLFDVAFPPEDADANVDWKPLNGQRGRDMNLERVAKQDNCCAYLRTQITSDEEQDVILSFGSDDGIKAWVNGKVVHANNATRGLTPDQDKVPVKLNKGVNALVVKVTNGGGQWAFSCGICAVEGGPPNTLKLEAK